MTEEQQEIYTKTVKRLARGGIKDPTAQIIALAEEIDCYRNKIFWLETRRTEVPAAPITHSPKPRYTRYDPGLGRWVIPLPHAERDEIFCFRLGMTTQKYPNCVFGEAIDKLALYENQEEVLKE